MKPSKLQMCRQKYQNYALGEYSCSMFSNRAAAVSFKSCPCWTKVEGARQSLVWRSYTLHEIHNRNVPQ